MDPNPPLATYDDPTIKALNDLLNITTNPQDLLHTILIPPQQSSSSSQKSNTNKKEHTYWNQIESLRCISKQLFSKLEQLALLNEKLDDDTDNKNNITLDHSVDDNLFFPLSGLSELYTGNNGTSSSSKEEEYKVENVVDSETIFNQVDIQNDVLISNVKKIIRKLGKKIDKRVGGGGGDGSSEDVVRLLNMQEMEDDDTDDEEEEEKKKDHSSVMVEETVHDQEEEEEDDDDDDGDEYDNNSDDEETKRIRQRMERSMAEMDSMSDNDDDSEEGTAKLKKEKGDNEEEAMIDPWRESLYDGFFDLHEMEQFADEEEEMLPDEAFGEPKQEEEESLERRKKSLPHFRAREGIEENDDDDDDNDEEFNELEKKVENHVRRKRYRGDEDIQALQEMYDKNESLDDEEDSDDDDDVINMTAADYFGPPKKPSKEFLQNKSKVEKTKKVTFDNDDDSWNDHDFTAEAKDWRDGDSDDDDDDLDKKKHQDDNDNTNEEEEKEVDENNEDEDIESDNDDSKTQKKLSNFSKRNTKLEQMTEQLEKDLLAEKPWQMVGETKGSERPTNSLLEVTPTFEVATKMAPIITVEHTLSIEEMIKKRILAEDWDDVIPRELPDIGLSKRQGELPEVSQEKSKLSLGELYEREYLKKVSGYDADAVEKETEEEKAKNEMKMLFANLCSKLDALSNYHFAPRPVADEAEVKSNATPAVAMEEVLPLHVSDAQAMAPEEIYAKKEGRDGILRNESELDQNDRKRLRQAKKAARRKARKAKLADEKLISRLKPELGLNNPYEKRKMREELQMARASGRVVTGEIDHNADYKTSAKFFQKMQSDVQMSLKDDNGGANNNKKRKRHGAENTKKSSSFKL